MAWPRVSPGIVAPLIAPALLLAYYWRYLGIFGPPEYFGAGDFMYQFWPFHAFNVHEWLAGRVPLWNNSIYGGEPHAAAFQGAVFYPLAIIELLLAGHASLLTGMYVRLWLDATIAALGMYFLVRRLTGNRSAAVLSAALYSLSASIAGTSWVDHIEALAWLPVTLWLLDRALIGSGRLVLNAWLAGWAMGAAMLGGYPELWLLFPPAIVALTLVRLGAPLAPAGESSRRGLPSAGAFWGRAVASWLVLAAAAGTIAAVQLALSLEFLSFSDRADHVGNGVGRTLGDLLGFVVPGADGDKGLYLGLLPLLLIVPALAYRRSRRRAGIWLALAGLGLLMGMGEHTPLYRLVFSRLGFDLFHGQTRNSALAIFAVAILAGIGLAELSRFHTRQWLAPLLVLAGVANLLPVTWGNSFPNASPTVPITDRYPRLLAALQTDARKEPMRFDIDAEQFGFSPNEAFRHDLETLGGNLNFQIGRSFTLRETKDWWRIWQLFNVRDVVGQRDLSGAGIDEVRDAADGQWRLFRIQYPLPRAFIVQDAVVATSADDALRRTTDNALDPGKTAVIEQPLETPLTPSANLQQRVRVNAIDPRQSGIEVQSSAAGLLVISQPYYPGWKVNVDGRPGKLLRVDYALEGVELPAGEHQLRLYYDPLSFKIGAAVSLLSIATFLGIVAIGRRRRASQPSSG